MKEELKTLKVKKWQKRCKHKIIIVNPMIQSCYCKRCYKKLDDLKLLDFVNKKIKQGKYETSYNSNIMVW